MLWDVAGCSLSGKGNTWCEVRSGIEAGIEFARKRIIGIVRRKENHRRVIVRGSALQCSGTHGSHINVFNKK